MAGALPLLYGMAEGIVVGATFEPPPPESERPPARPAMGTRRTRFLDAAGYKPHLGHYRSVDGRRFVVSGPVVGAV